jgi:hypothetical protein
MARCFTPGPTGEILAGLSDWDASDPLRDRSSLEIELSSVAPHDSLWEVAKVSGGRSLSGQHRSTSESPSEIESMIEPKLEERNNNTITTATLRFDNHLDSCNHPQSQGWNGITMTVAIVATRCSGHRPTTGTLCDSISSRGSSFARISATLRPPLSNSEASLRDASVLSRSSGELRGRDNAPDHSTFLIQKVLRFCEKGRSSSPQLVRISSGFLSGDSLAAKGDTLIHGPHLVAQSVGSEWRTQRPYQMDI